MKWACIWGSLKRTESVRNHDACSNIHRFCSDVLKFESCRLLQRLEASGSTETLPSGHPDSSCIIESTVTCCSDYRHCNNVSLRVWSLTFSYSNSHPDRLIVLCSFPTPAYKSKNQPLYSMTCFEVWDKVLILKFATRERDRRRVHSHTSTYGKVSLPTTTLSAISSLCNNAHAIFNYYSVQRLQESNDTTALLYIRHVFDMHV
jgi:hypothetical protein